MHDVIVAGGGPAGLAVALGAARLGLDVVVVDKRSGVVDKACGEGLMPGALEALQALGVDPPGAPITGITYRQGDTLAAARFAHGGGRGVRRVVLHNELRAAALAAGVRIETGTVTGGPYRWLRHPNYVAVVVEGFALPLVHTAWITALTFTVLNALLLRVRLRVENEALATAPAA